MAETNNQSEFVRTYHFRCGMVAVQEECTLEQDKKIIQLLSALDVDQGKFDLGKLTFDKIVHLIVHQGVLEQFLSIVLDVKENPQNNGFDDLKRSEIAAVINDFFSLSPALRIWLGTGKFVQGLLSAFAPPTRTSTWTSQETMPDSSDTLPANSQATSETQTKS